MDDLNSQDTDAHGPAVPEHVEVGPGTLRLLSDMVFGAPGVPELLDAHLSDTGHDPSKRWRLRLLTAVIVSEDGAPTAPPGAGPGTAGT